MKKYKPRDRRAYYLARQEEHKRVNKLWRDKNKERSKDNYLKRTYGISLETYRELLSKQNSLCAVCGKPQADETNAFAVDHDHVTLVIRGLLCSWCNHRVIGRWRNADMLQKAADYLRQDTGLYVPKPIKRRRKKRTK